MSANLAVHYTSNTDQHNTPRWLVDVIKELWGEIDLDPCTSHDNPCGAKKFYTIVDDGLDQRWSGGTVFMNPPYGRHIGDWTMKMHAQYALRRFEEGIALLPARTDTKWWKTISHYPVCFLQGRLRFNDVKQSAPFPSALVYMGKHSIPFRWAFAKYGTVYKPAARHEP